MTISCGTGIEYGKNSRKFDGGSDVLYRGDQNYGTATSHTPCGSLLEMHYLGTGRRKARDIRLAGLLRLGKPTVAIRVTLVPCGYWRPSDEVRASPRDQERPTRGETETRLKT
jgi:hypothetical protein